MTESMLFYSDVRIRVEKIDITKLHQNFRANLKLGT
jgi:hypothetical protein